MEYIGNKWNEDPHAKRMPEQTKVLAFYGQENCLVDANGRIHLTRRWVEDFLHRCSGEIVMHGLPEGAIALYPEDVYRDMRAREIGSVGELGTSFALRCSLRRFGALTHVDTITRQGRVTLPEAFREHAGILPGNEVRIIGVEVGVEIWNPARLAEEMRAIGEHQIRRRDAEMSKELQLENDRI